MIQLYLTLPPPPRLPMQRKFQRYHSRISQQQTSPVCSWMDLIRTRLWIYSVPCPECRICLPKWVFCLPSFVLSCSTTLSFMLLCCSMSLRVVLMDHICWTVINLHVTVATESTSASEAVTGSMGFLALQLQTVLQKSSVMKFVFQKMMILFLSSYKVYQYLRQGFYCLRNFSSCYKDTLMTSHWSFHLYKHPCFHWHISDPFCHFFSFLNKVKATPRRTPLKHCQDLLSQYHLPDNTSLFITRPQHQVACLESMILVRHLTHGAHQILASWVRWLCKLPRRLCSINRKAPRTGITNQDQTKKQQALLRRMVRQVLWNQFKLPHLLRQEVVVAVVVRQWEATNGADKERTIMFV